MPIEFERKFLVTHADLREIYRSDCRPEIFEIQDRYLDSTDAETPPLRIRTCSPKDAPSTVTTVLNTKVGLAGEALELEWVLPQGRIILADQLPWVEKLRHDWWGGEGLLHYHIEELVFPVSPAGELIAEVEFPNAQAKAAFVPPAHWIEVTGDKRYSNYSLAKYGWPVREISNPCAHTFSGLTGETATRDL